MKEVKTYISFDDKEFQSSYDCRLHELKIIKDTDVHIIKTKDILTFLESLDDTIQEEYYETEHMRYKTILDNFLLFIYNNKI
jgi:hypothetical protein